MIGGSDGVSDAVCPRATRCSALDALPCRITWRVVLLEQIYRACKISRGEPYHK
ncbi:MAG: 23S rRNA (pseudouridine(1915)-N(3))-methyltransferase RlmH [Collinsella sp.]